MKLTPDQVRKAVTDAEHFLKDSRAVQKLKESSSGSTRRQLIADVTGRLHNRDEHYDCAEVIRRYIEARVPNVPAISHEMGPAGVRDTNPSLPCLWSEAVNCMTSFELQQTTPPLAPAKFSTPVSPAPSTQPTPKEITMTIIKVETRVFINDVQSDKFTDPQLFALIQQQESKIKELDLIENKPASLAKEIQDRKDGISALVAYMDTKA